MDVDIVQVVTVLLNAVLTASAVVGAYAAWKGVSEWRRQLRGRDEHDLSRRLLRKVYHFRNQLRSARSPLIPPGEATTAFAELGQAEERNGPLMDPRTDEVVYQRRLRLVIDAWSELEVIEAEVLWFGSGGTRSVEQVECPGLVTLPAWRGLRRLFTERGTIPRRIHSGRWWMRPSGAWKRSCCPALNRLMSTATPLAWSGSGNGLVNHAAAAN